MCQLAKLLNDERRHLTREARAEWVRHLREKGLSIRAIADAVGASKSLVHKELNSGVQSWTPEPDPEPAEQEQPEVKPDPEPEPPKVTKEAIEHATAIMVDALARMGEFLRDAEMNRGQAGQFKPDNAGGSTVEPPAFPPTLADVGISKKESSVAQALATVRRRGLRAGSGVVCGYAILSPATETRCARTKFVTLGWCTR